MAAGVFEATVREGACRLRRPGTRWLSTGYAGGESRGPAAYNLSVPEGWAETDLDAYAADRLERAGFDEPGPALLTGVSQAHARRARLGAVEAVVTAGVSNPAALPVPGSGESDAATADGDADTDDAPHPRPSDADPEDGSPHGTVNVFVGTTRALEPGGLSNLLTVAAEAKAATLLARAGVPGTTTDAVVAACDPAGDPAPFSGSATPVGRAARACVRDALSASLDSRYPDPDRGADAAAADAEYGVVTDRRSRVSSLRGV